MKFEWDNSKARANIRKHGVSFEEASTVLADFYLSLYLTLFICKMKSDWSLLDSQRDSVSL